MKRNNQLEFRQEILRAYIFIEGFSHWAVSSISKTPLGNNYWNHRQLPYPRYATVSIPRPRKLLVKLYEKNHFLFKKVPF
jgi:hypothetical protein